MRLFLGLVFMTGGVATACYGDTDDFDKRVGVTRRNAERYQIRVDFHTGAELFTVEMPYAPKGMLFDNAVLAFSSAQHDLKIPVAVKKHDEELFVAFWGTRALLNASTLSIRFHRKDDVEGLIYVLRLKDLLVPDR